MVDNRFHPTCKTEKMFENKVRRDLMLKSWDMFERLNIGLLHDDL